jgi:TolB protein
MTMLVTFRNTVRILSLSLLCTLAAHADEPTTDTPLGTVDVTGSGGGIVLQHLNVVMRPAHREADSNLHGIVRNDLRLSGQFEVDTKSALELGDKDGVADTAALSALGGDIVVRVGTEDTGGVTELTAQVYLTKSAKKEPAFKRSILVQKGEARMAAHRLSDAILGALTGHVGSFASQLTYVARSGNGQQVFVADADGFGLRPYSPANQVALSPDFGPGGSVYYALSSANGPFRFSEGETAQPVVWPVVKGNVLGVAFAFDRKTLALTVANGIGSDIVVRAADGNTSTLPSAPNAHHPVFGPNNVLAWVAGNPPRVVVSGTAISPAGYYASSPTFCDSPQGLLVVFALSSGRDSALYVSDLKGNGARRLTSSGADESPACSADGRLVAYFAKRGKAPGLYIMPLAIPGHTQWVRAEVGSGLRWGKPEAK